MLFCVYVCVSLCVCKMSLQYSNNIYLFRIHVHFLMNTFTYTNKLTTVSNPWLIRDSWDLPNKNQLTSADEY